MSGNTYLTLACFLWKCFGMGVALSLTSACGCVKDVAVGVDRTCSVRPMISTILLCINVSYSLASLLAIFPVECMSCFPQFGLKQVIHFFFINRYFHDRNYTYIPSVAGINIKFFCNSDTKSCPNRSLCACNCLSPNSDID